MQRINTNDFMKAAKKGDLAVVQQYISENRDNADAIHNLNTALLKAACKGNVDILRALVAVPTVNINFAAQQDNAVKTFLMRNKLIVDCANTALMCASAYQHVEAVKYLLSVPGIAVHAKNNLSQTALASSLSKGNTEINKLLLSANPEEFDRESFLQLFLDIKIDTFDKIKKSTLLDMRDRTTPLGKLCERKLDFSTRCSAKAFFDEERSFKAKINAALSQYCLEQTNELKECIKSCYDSEMPRFKNELDLDKAVQLVKAGANPNSIVTIPYRYGAWVVGLVDVYSSQSSSVPVALIEDLLSFGLDPIIKTDISWLPNAHTLLFLRHGVDGLFAASRHSRQPISVLDFFAQKACEDKSLLPHIAQLLNYELPFTNEATVFSAVIEWLSQAKPEDVTPNICAYLKPHKLKMLDIIKRYPDKEALQILKEIFENENSAFRRVFFQGHAAITTGQLMLVHAEYKRRLANEKAVPVKVSLNDQLKIVLNAYPFVAEDAMKLVRQGADPHTSADDGISLIYQMIIIDSDYENKKNDHYVKELLEHPAGFPIQYYPGSQQKMRPDFFIRAIIKFIELGADPYLFSADSLMKAIVPCNKKENYEYFNAMRDPQRPLGKIGRKYLLRSGSAFSQASCDADKKIMTKIYALTDPKQTVINLDLVLHIKAYFNGKKHEFKLKDVLDTVREGANPNVIFYKKPDTLFSTEKRSYSLKDIFRDTMGTDKQFTLAELEELLMYGLDLSTATRDLFVATPDLYDYVKLIKRYGCQPRVGMPEGKTHKIAEKIEKPQALVLSASNNLSFFGQKIEEAKAKVADMLKPKQKVEMDESAPESAVGNNNIL